MTTGSVQHRFVVPSSMNTPPNAGFYIDENLDGAAYVGVLEAAGIRVGRCRDLGYRGVPDAIWIPDVTRLGYVIVTADDRTRYRPAEKRALVSTGARVIVQKLRNRTHRDLADNFAASYASIERFVRRHPGPWVATLSMPARSLKGGTPAGVLTRLKLD